MGTVITLSTHTARVTMGFVDQVNKSAEREESRRLAIDARLRDELHGVDSEESLSKLYEFEIHVPENEVLRVMSGVSGTVSVDIPDGSCIVVRHRETGWESQISLRRDWVECEENDDGVYINAEWSEIVSALLANKVIGGTGGTIHPPVFKEYAQENPL